MSHALDRHSALHLSPARPRDARARAVALWLQALCLLLLGYALLGRGWAYIGIPPLFLGEATLLAGMVVLLAVPGLRRVFGNGHALGLIAFMVWGAFCTIPYVPKYGADALRDAVIWGYATFALLVFVFLTHDASWLPTLIRYYQRFACLFLIAMPPIWALTQLAPEVIPFVPGTRIPLIHAKAGDVQVHLAGILVLWVAGWGRASGWWLLLLVINVLTIGVFNRGGMLSFLCVLLICLALRPQTRLLWRLALIVTLVIALMAATDMRVSVPGKSREVSFSQILANFESIGGSSSRSNLDGTKEWRLLWWGDIVDYTVWGPHFWTGKGFGINLADDDGFQVRGDEGRLRSPHNGHLTVLARSGVPGLALWILVQASWASSILLHYFRARRASKGRWAGLFLLLLGYWVAFMANASFDVFIEGPMGGIWFWTIYGIGLAAMWCVRYRPDVMSEIPASLAAVTTAGHRPGMGIPANRAEA